MYLSEFLGWLQNNGIALASLLATVALVISNIMYLNLTKKILDSTVRQSKLIYHPVIGIGIEIMNVYPVFRQKRKQLSIGLSLTNVGNAPAIEVSLDAEIILQYSNIQGEKVVPAQYEPGSIAFVRPGVRVADDLTTNLTFSDACVTHLFDDFRELNRLNLHRIETDPTKKPYQGPILKVYVNYRNSLNQYFESVYETQLSINKIPEENERVQLFQNNLSKPIFHTTPTTKEKVDTELFERNRKRTLAS
jgi:hypothetical protein